MFCFSVRPAPETPDLASMMMSSSRDQLRLGERQQREQHGGRIAAGTGDEPRCPDLVAIMLGQPVDGVLDQLGRAVLVGVPLGIEFRIAQAEIGRHVDDLDALRELGDLGVRRAVRQAAEDDVDLVPVDLVGGDERRRIEAGEMREDLRQGLPGMALGDQRGDLDARDAARRAGSCRRRYSRRRRARRL